ncbi:MAG: helix-turn-helix transcriptional regulator [Clostridia bacterium]|nr:helix-turn-helix transcriptional regulator [Clostridia bacterium]MBQ4397823.1 helix-turn-helix transcriptional regulator [Clostridia bacterium]MBQ5544136.1 helix-turn-helix transcriptional regulator [Clostridia bacterium]
MVFTRLREFREKKGLTQSKVAGYLNCSQQVYSNYELGQRDIPTDVLIALVKLFDVSADYLLGITDNPKINR